MTSRLTKECNIAGCGSRQWSRGWCRKHYYRWHKHGDPLKTVIAFTQAGLPRSFIDGLPTSGEGCVRWPFAKNNVGYAQINNRKSGKKLVSRIVCEIANGPPPTDTHVAAHECGKGHEACVAPWHLKWKTPAENSADMVRHGTRLHGERHNNKLTAKQVREIRAIGKSKSQAKIALKYGVSQRLIGRIINREAWRHLPDLTTTDPRHAQRTAA